LEKGKSEKIKITNAGISRNKKLIKTSPIAGIPDNLYFKILALIA
jgi:hypothetical protein